MEVLKEIGYIIGIQLIELSNSLIIMWGIFQCRLRKTISLYCVALISYVLIIGCTVITNNQKNIPPICVLAELIIVILCFEDSIIKRLALYFISYIYSYIITSLLEMILFVLFHLEESVFFNNFFIQIMIQALSIFIVILITIPLKKIRSQTAKRVSEIPFHYYAIGLPGLFCCATVLSFLQMESKKQINNESNDQFAIICMTLVCLFFIIGSVILTFIEESRQYHMMQSKLKEKYINLQKNHYKRILSNDEELRKFKHDFKAHIGCMKILSEGRKFEELDQYIQTISNGMDKLLVRNINSGNAAVDAVMNYMEVDAQKEGMQIHFTGSVPDNLIISGFDLCTILTNAVTNAIEACRKISEKEMRIIDIKIGMYKNLLHIIVENPVSCPVDIKILGKGTGKEDKKNHGFGIQNMIDTANKYNGNVSFINKKNRFKVEILLDGAI